MFMKKLLGIVVLGLTGSGALLEGAIDQAEIADCD